MRSDGSAPQSKRRRLRIGVAVALVALIGLAGAALTIGRVWLGETDVDVTPGPAAAPALTPEERAYYDYVAPRLRELAAQARELARLGEEKSRDLFQIQARGDRLNELIEEIAAYGRAHGIPERFAVVGAGFAEGARLTRQAMAESRRGFTTFDWDRVAAAVPVFLAGADRLDEAVAELERLGGAATPPGGGGAERDGQTGRRADGEYDAPPPHRPTAPPPHRPTKLGYSAGRSWSAGRRLAPATHPRRERRRAIRVPKTGGGADEGGGGRGGEAGMRYDVTFQVGGDERVERVEAPDAASAVEAVRAAYRGTTDLFELIQVHLLEDDGAHNGVTARADGEGTTG